MLETFTPYIIYIVIPFIVYIFRSLIMLKQEVDTKMNRKEVSDLIDIKKEVTDFQYKSLKEDMDEVKDKLDRLIEHVHSTGQ